MRLLWIPIFLGLFLAITLCLRFGWQVGRRRLKDLGEGANEGLGAIDGAVFGLMGLLLAFTFTGAASRFDERRALIVQETNAIGTAWLRLDLLPPEPREQARDLFRRYLDQRLDTYKDTSDRDRINKSLAATAALQGEIWNLVMTQWREGGSMPLVTSLVPALNEMFDVATSRLLATRQHPHPVIYGMLLGLVLVTAFLLGFSQGKVANQSKVHLLGFAVITAVALYIIFDLEHPRLGLIRVDSFDQALVELRASMN
jgi:hypothetical protein